MQLIITTDIIMIYIFIPDFSILAPKNCERQMETISTVLAAASDEEKIEILHNPVIGNKKSYKFYLCRHNDKL